MTTKQKQIAKSAREILHKADYQNAFDTLLKGGSSFFIYTITKPDSKDIWISNKAICSKFFWSIYIIQEKVLKIISQDDSFQHLLHFYFKSSGIREPKFEDVLVSQCAHEFVKCVRSNQIFLKDEYAEYLTSASLPEEYCIHKRLWSALKFEDQSLWNCIDKTFTKVSLLALNELLISCIVWIEEKRFNCNDETTLNHLGEVYNFFIELVIKSDFLNNRFLTNETDFILEFHKTILDKQKHTDNLVYSLLNNISKWIDFRNRKLDPYCFDLTITPINIDNSIYLKSTADNFYKWKLDGIRYNVIHEIYLEKGALIVNDLIDDGFVIHGKDENIIILNYQKEQIRFASHALMCDLCLNQLQSNGNSITPDNIIYPILNYIFYQKNGYEENIKSYSNNTDRWNEVFIKLTLHAIRNNINFNPFIYRSKNDLVELFMNQLKDNFNHRSIDFYTSSISNTKFNRYNISYNVWMSPFFVFGDYLFCPLAFFANNDWFFALSQKTLKEKANSEDTNNLELYLSDKFNQKGWHTERLTQKQVDELDGDVDVFVWDDESLLYIQLKRSYFRLDLRQSHSEMMFVQSKAIKQLNSAEEYIKSHNSIFNTHGKNPVKWYVSTSLEHTNELINCVRKVNYFELLYVLENPEIIKVKDLITFVETDRLLNLRISSNIHHISKLRDFNIEEYCYPIYTENDQGDLFYQEAMELYESGKYEEANLKIQKCTELNCKDFFAWNLLANCLAQLNAFENSFKAFEQTLELIPNDPQTMRDYAIALMEGKSYFKGLKMAKELYKKFPYYSDAEFVFKEHYKTFKKLGLLSSEQINLIDNL